MEPSPHLLYFNILFPKTLILDLGSLSNHMVPCLMHLELLVPFSNATCSVKAIIVLLSKSNGSLELWINIWY